MTAQQNAVFYMYENVGVATDILETITKQTYGWGVSPIVGGTYRRRVSSAGTFYLYENVINTFVNGPPVTAGLVYWGSSQYETGYADNDGITTWTDLSGFSNHAVYHPGSGVTPRWRSSLGPGGGACIEYPNTGHDLGNIMKGAIAGEVFATVLSTNTPGTAHGGLGFGTSGNSSHYPFEDSLVYSDFGSTTRKTGISVGSGAVDIESWHRLNIWSADNDWCMRINESVVHSTGTNTVSWLTAPTIGSYGGGPSGQTLYYGGILVYNRKLTTSERASVAAWQTSNMNGGLP